MQTGIFLSLFFISSLTEIKDEASLRGWDASIWTQNNCEQLLVRIPSTSGSTENAILLHSTFEPNLLVTRVHWDAVKNIQNRSRDVYLAVTCGEVYTATFIHIFLKKLEGFFDELDTSEKVQFAFLGELFPNLSKIKFVWNEGADFDCESAKPWIVAPIGISQRGFWGGKIRLGEGSLPLLQSRLMTLTDRLEEISTPKPFSLRALHYEQSELVSRLLKTETWWQSILDFINPRLFYFRRDWQRMLSQSWAIGEIEESKEPAQNFVVMEHSFIGAREQKEIEAEVSDLISSIFRKDLSFDIETVHFSSFLRSVYQGKEADAFDRQLKMKPQVIPVPVISAERSESRLFREAGLLTYDFSPDSAEVEAAILSEILK